MESLQRPAYLVGDWTSCTTDKNEGWAGLNVGQSES